MVEKFYANAFVRITFGGTFDGEEEIWTNNLSIVDLDSNLTWTGPVGPSALTAAIEKWHESSGAQISNRCRLAWVKVANIKTDGKYNGEAFFYEYPTPIPGGSPGAVETTRSLTLSFKTENPRGKAANGRIYIPGYNSSVGTNGRLTGSTQNNVLTAGKTFIDEVNAALSVLATDNARVGVTAFAETAPRAAYATSIRVGDVIDMQRRRKNKMIENYVSADLAP